MSPSFLWLIIIKCSPKMDTSEIVHNLLRTSPFWILDFAWLNNNFWEQWITFSIWNITLSFGWPFWKVAMVSLTCWSLLLFDCVIMLNLSRLFKISHIFVFTGFFFFFGCLFVLAAATAYGHFWARDWTHSSAATWAATVTMLDPYPTVPQENS